MQLTRPKEKQHSVLSFSGSTASLLKQLNINPETVIVAVNGVIVGDDHHIADEDKVTIFSVISGG